jgi:predicted flap endonuclease-1-like 5' DNA nuclease
VSATPAANATPATPDPNLPKNAAPDQPDDLKIIEGIGPKMEKALQAAGINTFAMLAGASEAQIRDAIVAAGMRFAPTVPTWAEQASYAANGDFVGLEAYQKTLIGGRKTK